MGKISARLGDTGNSLASKVVWNILFDIVVVHQQKSRDPINSPQPGRGALVFMHLFRRFYLSGNSISRAFASESCESAIAQAPGPPHGQKKFYYAQPFIKTGSNVTLVGLAVSAWPFISQNQMHDQC